VTVAGDRQLRKVFENLLKNAIEPSRRRAVDLAESGDGRCRVSLENGVYLIGSRPPTCLNPISPLHQRHRPWPAISRKIVEAHGGTLIGQPDHRLHLSLFVELPLWRGCPSPPAVRSDHASAYLVVDDEPVQRQMLQGFLEKQGFEVMAAAGGGRPALFAQHPIHLVPTTTAWRTRTATRSCGAAGLAAGAGDHDHGLQRRHGGAGVQLGADYLENRRSPVLLEKSAHRQDLAISEEAGMVTLPAAAGPTFAGHRLQPGHAGTAVIGAAGRGSEWPA
jgi:hypothetical protein